jgi:hypothetical protein
MTTFLGQNQYFDLVTNNQDFNTMNGHQQVVDYCSNNGFSSYHLGCDYNYYSNQVYLDNDKRYGKNNDYDDFGYKSKSVDDVLGYKAPKDEPLDYMYGKRSKYDDDQNFPSIEIPSYVPVKLYGTGKSYDDDDKFQPIKMPIYEPVKLYGIGKSHDDDDYPSKKGFSYEPIVKPFSFGKKKYDDDY